MSSAPEVTGQLPSGWTWISIGETGKYINGFAFKPSHRGSQGLPIVRIQNLTDASKPINLTTLDVPADYKIDSGDMLVSWSATLDVFIWRRGPALVNQHIFKVVPDERVFSKELLFHWLGHAIRQLQESDHLHGSTMMHINRGPFMAHRLPLPPLAEQARIVTRLEELLSDLDAGVAELKAVQKKLHQYRLSLLKAAVEGDLTATWRKERRARLPQIETGAQLLQRIQVERRTRWEANQVAKFTERGDTPPKEWQNKYRGPSQPDIENLPPLPDGWAWATVDQTGEVQLGRQRAPRYHSGPNMVPYLRVANVFEDRIDISDVMEMHFSTEDEAAFKLNYNDILLNEGQSLELVGRPAIYRDELPRACFTNTLVRFRPETDVVPEYALALFRYYMHSGRFQKIATITTNIAHLGAGRFAQLEFPLPSHAEQVEIVQRLSEQFAQTSQQAAAVELGLKQAAAQRQNILNSALAGQLVPQDPNDEPADVLLNRIRIKSLEQSKQPKARRAKQSKEIATVIRELEKVLAEAGDWVPAQEAFRRCGIVDGATTESIEDIYAELRKLDKAGRLAVEPVTDAEGRKLHDKLKLLAG